MDFRFGENHKTKFSLLKKGFWHSNKTEIGSFIFFSLHLLSAKLKISYFPLKKIDLEINYHIFV